MRAAPNAAGELEVAELHRVLATGGDVDRERVSRRAARWIAHRGDVAQRSGTRCRLQLDVEAAGTGRGRNVIRLRVGKDVVRRVVRGNGEHRIGSHGVRERDLLARCA